MPLNKIEIRSEEIDEILGKTPGSMIRWGISIFFIVIILLLAGSWFFKYPDFISSKIEITSTNPPADIITKTSGKIENIFVSDNEIVHKGQVLAIVENPALYYDVILLVSGLASFSVQSFDSININAELLKENFSLGELQVYFSPLVVASSEYLSFIKIDFYNKKIEALKKQKSNQQIFYNRTWDQRLTLEKDLELAKKEMDRFESLFRNQTIPETEYEKMKSSFLQKQYSYEGAKSNLANIKIQISQVENSILDLQLQQEQTKIKLLQTIQDSYNNLLSQIDIWENKYILKSPVNGICTFTKYWSKNQNVVAGEKVMTIIPEGESKIIGKLLLPVQGSGKVKTGQKVNIQLLNYPYMEFGMVSGLITKISLVPNDTYYYVEVVFPEELLTSYDKSIPFSQNLQGSAEIITDDIRLFDRILKPIKSLIKNRTVK